MLQVLYTDDLCAGEQVFFAATGVSDGDLLRGVRYFAGGASSNSIVMRSGSGTGTGPLLYSIIHVRQPHGNPSWLQPAKHKATMRQASKFHAVPIATHSSLLPTLYLCLC